MTDDDDLRDGAPALLDLLDRIDGAPALLDLLDRIDHTKEPSLLLPLLKIPPEVRPHFEDLFKSLVFKSRSRRTPSDRLPYNQLTLLYAMWCVKTRPRGVKQADAITDVAQRYGFVRGTLE